MNIRIAIVDDRQEDRKALRDDLPACMPVGMSASISCFESSEALLQGFTPKDDSLIFMDICMEGMNGIEAARRVRSRSARCLIVFLTTSRDYAFEAFPIHPFDYLIKPYQKKEITRILDSAFRVMSESEEQVEIRMPRMTMSLAHNQITAIASHGHTVDVFTVGGAELKSSMTFRELEKALNGDERFLPCNRGILINMDEALKLENGENILMADGTRYPLRQRNRLELVNRFMEYQVQRMKRG